MIISLPPPPKLLNFPFGENIMVRNVLEEVNIKLAVYTIKRKSQV